ncbi:hypothetical protein niasHT_016002 [Heterodera trifolii]|uniref:Effector protein n=1 Tax=Heterodera trifolii TaxID=157864 RepID=A0ABD2LB51_9BILA
MFPLIILSLITIVHHVLGLPYVYDLAEGGFVIDKWGYNEFNHGTVAYEYHIACVNPSTPTEQCKPPYRYCKRNNELQPHPIALSGGFENGICYQHHHHHHHDHSNHSLNAPRQRFTILQANDGDVQPPGSLLVLNEITYEILVQEFIGEDGPAGFSGVVVIAENLCRGAKAQADSPFVLALFSPMSTYHCIKCSKLHILGRSPDKYNGRGDA